MVLVSAGLDKSATKCPNPGGKPVSRIPGRLPKGRRSGTQLSGSTAHLSSCSLAAGLEQAPVLGGFPVRMSTGDASLGSGGGCGSGGWSRQTCTHCEGGNGRPGLARWGCEVLKPQGGGVVYLRTIISCSFPHLEGCLKAGCLAGSRIRPKDAVARVGQGGRQGLSALQSLPPNTAE